ncbi:MAG TPA: hypothetical protein VGR89_13850 [Puia sp.]|nr:hypothetical protein [Puia sp.]
MYGDVTSPSFKGLYDGQFDFRKLLSRNISHQAIFYNRTIFERIGVYNLRYRMHADWDLNLRCFADPAVHPKYVRVTVARFGAGGVSAGHDELFLRERLIPAKLRQLNLDGTRKLRHVGQYDEWWRVLRNAGIRDVGELQKYTGKEALPGAIRRIVKWQQHLGPAALRRGLASKARMLLAYIRERVIPSRDD